MSTIVQKTNEDKQQDWKEMTKKRRRIAILHDALERIKGNQYSEVTTGSYIRPQAPARTELDPDAKSLTEDQLTDLAKTCQVCIRGALLFSRFFRFDNATPDGLGFDKDLGFKGAGPKTTSQGLKGAFSKKQLVLMEIAFERNGSFAEEETGRDRPSYDQVEDALRFGRKYAGSTHTRAIEIIKNAISNDGEFKPEQLSTSGEYGWA